MVIATNQPVRRQIRMNIPGVLKTLLAGYSGGITIIRELTQNADDAPGEEDRWIEFHFMHDRLIVRNSTSFRDEDFDNIEEIARGGKQLETRSTIGAFGVGFTSVYQLTDTPIVRSSGREIKFFLETQDLEEQPSTVIDFTEFELPYRREVTPVSITLGMPPVTEDWVEHILNELPDETQRLLLFLRRVDRIAIFDGERLVAEVSRKTSSAKSLGGPEHLRMTLRSATGAKRTQSWLRFTGKTECEPMRTPEGRPEKDQTVQVAVPDTDITDQEIAGVFVGRLYNYLPTEIRTGLPFQINGDFYPSTDRKSIDNDRYHHQLWHTAVLEAIGDCFAQAIPYLLERFREHPEQFYRRLPIMASTALAAPIVEACLRAARDLPLFATRQGWRTAADVFRVETDLRPLLEGMDLPIMELEREQILAPLMERLDVRTFGLPNLIQRWQQDIRVGTSLRHGPTYLQTPEQLSRIYTHLEERYARSFGQQIAQAPIFLDHEQQLRPANQCRRTPNNEVRETLAESGLHFWAGNDNYAYLLQQIPSLILSDIWTALRLQLPQELPLRNAPAWLNTNQKLYRLYRAILDVKSTSERVQRDQVAGVPICLCRNDWLRQPGTISMPGNDPVIYDIFADDPDLQLVARSTHENLRYRQLYLDLGVRLLNLEAIVERLGRFSRAETLLAQAHPCLNTREKLLRVYRYLRDQRQQLTSADIQALRHRMAIWLCQDGCLRFAHGSDGSEVMTPPVTADWPQGITVSRVLAVENRDALGTLFEVINIKPLDTATLIDHFLLPQFAQLTWNEQKSALKYLETHIELLMRDPKLLERVRTTPLVIADDGQLYRADSLCYPSEEVAQIFGDSVRTPEIPRYFGKDVPSDPAAKWPWYRVMISILGLGTCPPPNTVLTCINALMREPVDSSRHLIEKLFRYLERHWEAVYQRAGLGRHLREMAWLPADGTNDRLYRPTELFPSQEKILVGHVAPILGFREVRRPQKAIADALGFPSVFERNAAAEMPHAPKVVEELLILSQLGEAANGQIYKYLNEHLLTGTNGLLKLKGKKVIWTGDRYWNAEHIFFQNYRRQFGSYRGYVINPTYPDLLRKLGAHEQPNLTDYRNIVLEISEKIGDAAVPDEEQAILLHAYDCLGDAEGYLLDPLKRVASVLSCPAVQARNGLGEMHLRRPDQIVLPPADRYIEALPNLPVARCNPDGVALLNRIGVRLLDRLVYHKMAETGSLRQPTSISSFFAGLGRPLKRLLYHFLDSRSVQQREQALWNTIKVLRAYELPILTVTYVVELDGTIFKSDARDENMFFDAHQQEVYMRSGLDSRARASELALILHQLLAISALQPAMLREILLDPSRADQEMDYNQIHQLPQHVEVGPISDDLEGFWTIGAQAEEDNLVDPEEEVLAASGNSELFPDPAAAQHSSPNSSSIQKNHKTPPPQRPMPQAQGEPLSSESPIVRPSDPTTNGHNGHKPAAKPQIAKPADTTAAEKSVPQHPAVAMGPRPAFVGRTEMSSPTIATDVDGLLDRAQRWKEEHHQPPTTPSKPEATRDHRHTGINPAEPREQTIVRFVLTFPEATQGFLRLNTRAQQLFPGQPDRVYCRTSEGKDFTLWLDWKRRQPIAYADEMRAYFASQEIPGGGIVYIEQLHRGEYRLFYNPQPHEVRAVRIALNEQGQLIYEHIPSVKVNCETVDTIYRAEKRHEDQIALYMDAAGKKSILETLCDLFMADQRTWIHQDDLKAMVMAERMVADSSVQQTLQSKECFVPDEHGFWRFVPDKLAASLQQDPFIIWQKATQRLMKTDLVTARRFNREVAALIGDLSLWLRSIASVQASQGLAGIEELVKRIIDTPQEDKPASELRQLVIEHLSIEQSLDDAWLHTVLETVSTAGIVHVLRPALRDTLDYFRRAGRMGDIPALMTLWNSYDAGHGYDLGKTLAEVETWRVLNRADVTLVELVTTIRQQPEIVGLQPRLKTAIFRDLHRLDPKVWLMNGIGVAAVDSGIVGYKPLLDARRYLNLTDQRELDRAIRDCCLQIWDDLNDEGRVALVLSTRNNLPLAEVKENQIAFLRREAERRREREPVMALLLGTVAWQALSSNDRLHRPYIAAHLAACYRRLEIWELAQGQGWLRELNRREADDLSGLGLYYAATHTRRMTAFCQLLQQDETHVFAKYLQTELSQYTKLAG